MRREPSKVQEHTGLGWYFSVVPTKTHLIYDGWADILIREGFLCFAADAGDRPNPVRSPMGEKSFGTRHMLCPLHCLSPVAGRMRPKGSGLGMDLGRGSSWVPIFC